MSVICLEHLTKSYGTRIGIEDIDLRVPEGTIFGFLGPNGSGKTTTLRVLMGFLYPTRGAARIFGMDCWKESHRIKAEVGYLPGDLRLPPWLTCREALRIFGRVRGRDLLSRGLGLAERFGLEPGLRVRTMSRGTRQKLGLVLALAHAPRLLMLDEPTASLDPLMQEKLYALLREAVKDGTTVLFSSHTLSEVEDLCSQAAILRAGRLAESAPLDVLRSRAKRRVTIQWRSIEDALRAPHDGVEWVQRDGRRWRGVVKGPVSELLRWMSTQPIDDVVLERPDLREVFYGFYAEQSDVRLNDR